MLSTLLIFAFLASGCDFMQTVLHTGPRNGIYLMPSGYVGAVVILYDQPDGETLDVEDGYYVYKIPPSGVLKVRTPPYTGIVNLKILLCGSGGREARGQVHHDYG